MYYLVNKFTKLTWHYHLFFCKQSLFVFTITRTMYLESNSDIFFSKILVEQYMCHLSYSKGRNTYYNAVLLQVCLFTKQIENVQSISLLKKPQRNAHSVLLLVPFDLEVVMYETKIKNRSRLTSLLSEIWYYFFL